MSDAMSAEVTTLIQLAPGQSPFVVRHTGIVLCRRQYTVATVLAETIDDVAWGCVHGFLNVS